MPNTITPFLWFDGHLREAIDFYTSVFADSEVLNSSTGPDGELFLVTFRLNGQQFMALNGGPEFKFTEAVSFYISCNNQAEVDDLWAKLTADGGEESRCGWLKDRFGLWWQVVPTALGELLGDPDPVRAGRVREAMLQMGKIDIAGLERAYRG